MYKLETSLKGKCARVSLVPPSANTRNQYDLCYLLQDTRHNIYFPPQKKKRNQTCLMIMKICVCLCVSPQEGDEQQIIDAPPPPRAGGSEGGKANPALDSLMLISDNR